MSKNFETLKTDFDLINKSLEKIVDEKLLEDGFNYGVRYNDEENSVEYFRLFFNLEEVVLTVIKPKYCIQIKLIFIEKFLT